MQFRAVSLSKIVICIAVIFVGALLFVIPGPIRQRMDLFILKVSDPQQTLFLGQALSVSDKNIQLNSVEQDTFSSELVNVSMWSGPDAGSVVSMNDYSVISTDPDVREGIQPGETLLVLPTGDAQAPYQVADIFRIPAILFIVLIFIVFLAFVAGRRGLLSLVGLLMGFLVLLLFFVPRILVGANVIMLTLITAAVITLLSQCFAHGFNKITSVAIAGTIISLVVAVFTSTLFVWLSGLVGFDSSDTSVLKVFYGSVNFHDLLFAGIIIGVLGILDDIAIGQAVGIAEIARAAPTLGIKELYARGMNIGKQHIASLVNTLVLAYVGAFLPVFLILVVNVGSIYPAGLLSANNELVAEEVIRALVGGITLMLAVPITTFFAAYYCGRRSFTKPAGK